MKTVVRDLIVFKQRRDRTYHVILLQQGYEYINNIRSLMEEKKLLMIIPEDSLDKMYLLFSACNDRLSIEVLPEELLEKLL